MTLTIALIIGFAAGGLLQQALRFAFSRSTADQFVISDDPHRSIDDKELLWRVSLNSALSFALIIAVCFGFEAYLFHSRDIPLWHMALEFLGVLFLYDFAYYFVHRYPFHEWRLLRNAHAIHHAAQFPRPMDALLLHPVETFLGLSLFFGSIAAVGGVHLYTFALMFFCYTTLNILNHAGINIPRFPMKTLGVLAVKHDKHHHSMLSGNYASITPLPDMVFGTVE